MIIWGNKYGCERVRIKSGVKFRSSETSGAKWSIVKRRRGYFYHAETHNSTDEMRKRIDISRPIVGRIQLPDIHRTVMFPRTCVPYAPRRNGSARGDEAIVESRLASREEVLLCAAHLASTLTMPFAPRSYHARYVHA